MKDAAPRWWVLLVLLVGLSVSLYVGAGGRAERSTVFEGRTMGTTYRIVLGRAVSGSARAALQAAIDRRLAEVNASMSTYDPSSELSRFNRHAATTPFPVSPALAEVVRLSLAVSRASGGAFDVTVGPLVDAWGFGPAGRPQKAPDDAALAALREAVGYEKLKVEGNALVKTHPGLRVDLSAIAKGHGVDEVAALLEAHGHDDYLVEIGGELRAWGRNAEGRPFRIGIEEPLVHDRAVRARITLEGGLATSGNYRNRFELDGQIYVHTLDPSTGRPVRHALLSASVLHPRCAVADAWATALMSAGPERAWQLARAEGLEVYLLVGGENGKIDERITPGFLARRHEAENDGKSP